MVDSFVHLHVHTEYSMLDGAARLKDLFAECSRMEMPALAMTDHGNLYGAYDFYHQAVGAGVKPIIGMEAYVTPGTSRFDKTRVRWAEGGENDVSGGGAYTHMTLLAQDAEGLRNLYRLASYASLEGFFYKPRIDRELLHRYSKGIIATTGCPSGEIQTWLRIGDYAKAREAAGEFRDIFGEENFYLELMAHGLEIENKARDGLIKLKDDLGLPAIATNDLHYTFAEDAKAHEALLCVQSGKTLADPNRFRFDAQDFYLKSPEEMRKIWDGEVPGACDNTLLIAERIGDYSPVFAHRDLQPRFPIPEGETEESWLRKEVDRGLIRRFGEPVSADYLERSEYELGVISQMGFPGYFLVVSDLVRYAKRNGFLVGWRGSAGGSLVAYALDITEMDPIKHGCMFERFLNPERISMPDIDLDFDERGRTEVMRYVTERYGVDRVSQIVTYSTIKAKAAVKDSSRVLGYPYALGDRITKAMPPAVMGKDVPLSGIFDSDHPRYGEAGEFRQLYETDTDVQKVVDTARGLEGLIRQWGVHAAGVILSSEPLSDVLPIQRREADGAIITQFDMNACEELGLLKMDFLGLRNLSILEEAIKNVELNTGRKIVLTELSLDDMATFELLARGDTLGVFQLDGGPMRALLRSMRPDKFEDISAVIALYRPGPMGANAHYDYADRKNSRKPVEPIHNELAEPLAEILDETYGVIVYQEQVLAIAQKVAGYSLGKADLLRKAMGKKKKEVLDKEFGPFSEGMRDRDYSEAAIKTLWDILVPFSDYAFNKAHTVAYGLVAYWTAYLKANYPASYMAALLTSVRDDKDRMAIYLNECRRQGIKVLPPDVNESDANFTPVGDDVRFGLSGVRNVGINVVDAIVATRSEKDRYADFTDFLAKVPAAVCNKRVVESLAKAGAFDSLGHRRRQLVVAHEEAVEYYADQKRHEAIGQDSLFGFGDEDASTTDIFTFTLPDIDEWDKQTLLVHERDMLGLYVSDHPLFGIEHVLAQASDTTIGSLLTDEDRPDGSVVSVGGLITALTRKMTKRGDAWAIVSLEDLEGAIDVMFFPSTYQLVAPQLTQDTVVVVKGRLDRRDDQPQLIAMELSIPDLSNANASGPVAITLGRERCTPPTVDKLKEIFATHPGMTDVHLHLRSHGKTLVMRLEDRWRVTPSTELMGDLKALLGPGCVVA